MPTQISSLLVLVSLIGVGIGVPAMDFDYNIDLGNERLTWDAAAFRLFQQEVTNGASNQANADAVAQQLRQSWSNDGEQYYVAVNDDTKLTNFTLLANETAGEGKIKYGTFGGKYLFAMMLAKSVTTDLCLSPINKTLMEQVMNLSSPSAVTSDPDTMLQSVLSFDKLNIKNQGVFVSADSTSIGIQDTFSNDTCTFIYTTSSWTVFTYAYRGPEAPDFNYFSHFALVNALTDSPKASNEDLASDITQLLATSEPDKIWAVMISDFSSSATTSTAYGTSDFKNQSLANWPSNDVSNNFCGKNMIVYGGTYAGGDLECSEPATGFFQYFHYVASEATSASGANVTTVINQFEEKGLEYYIGGQLIMVAKDSKAGIKHALSPLCEYDSGDSYSPWKILYYGTSL